MNVMTGSSLLLNSAGYQISRSVRLRSSASAYFNRTQSTPTDEKKFTLSAWVKRGILSTQQAIFGGRDNATAQTPFQFTSGNAISWGESDGVSTFYTGTTAAVFRDPSAWYHIVSVYDSNNATAADRLIIYVNGVRQTITITGSGSSIPLSRAGYWNQSGTVVEIGRTNNDPSTSFDGYITEAYFIDGQALTPSSFGETNPVTGVWQPKKYTGTYGTNGFYLNFSDNSAATAAAIGKDYSGNGNNWTPNNITLSPTTSASYDSMLDVPTQWADGGNGRGNYCTFNPLVGTHSNTYSNGNLQVATSTANAAYSNQRATFGVSSGKWYWEITCQATNSAFYVIGITADTVNPDTQYIGQGNSYSYRSDTGQKATNGTFSTYGATFTTGDIIGVEFDADAGTLVFYKNNVSQGTAFTSISGTYFPAVSDLDNNTGRNSTFVANFGQRPFAYTPPSGFKALNTLNLPTPTILKGNQYFDATLYTGTSASNAVVNAGGFQPDLVWLKNRNYVAGTNHVLVDAVRGVSVGLASNLTNADFSTVGNFSSINSNGFTVTGTARDYNFLSDTFVGWQWKEGATQGFDIVTYTGDGVDGRTVAHNLGVVPKMVIVKSRSTATNWNVKHASLSSNNVLQLNTTDAQSTPGSGYIGDLNSSTTFTLKNGGAAITNVNGNGTTYVAYVFAAIAGYSAFGSYTGNGSADGPFVFCGFRPRFILIKESTPNARGWRIFDTARNPYNQSGLTLSPNTSDAEDTGSGLYNQMDILSNGFKLRAATNSEPTNESGATYIYAAFCESPFKNSLAR